jgi:tetratricopeptide (TPR) repeat protein
MPLCLCASPDSTAELYSKANQAFASGHYADAVAGYEAIAERDGVSAPLLFNLANACYRDGKIGRAILCYERAHWLAPRDPDIEANLRLVRKAGGLFVADDPWWREIAGYLSMDGWAVSGSVALALLCALATVRFLWTRFANANRNFWRIPAAILVLLLALSVFSLVIRVGDLNRAVILIADTPLRISPYDTANVDGTLPAGETVRLQKRYNQYFHVQTPQGKTGWISGLQVEKVVR